MKSVTKNIVFFIILFVSTITVAQKPAAPTQLEASFQKYPNRIELKWKVATANPQYKIYRRDKTKKKFELIDSVNQNRYIDKKDLKPNTLYTYHVRAVGEKGKVSDKSKEAIGALLTVASEKDTSLPVSPVSIKDCIEVTITQSKFVSQNFIFKFLLAFKCDTPPSVQLDLFRSNDDKLDEHDNLLSQEILKLPANRHSISVKNNGEPTTGFLLLKISTPTNSFVVAKKIE
jgi:hypothetical protein